ncbi:unnamed protein product [Mytilus coruscus]|uniref:Uncharacterized protein n=1 Tax=Mytilus coruscus TaxID=42192 RepID=A0A6J8BA54_MYTCO|nr:unnamed protein product [Mytilus coruscus]
MSTFRTKQVEDAIAKSRPRRTITAKFIQLPELERKKIQLEREKLAFEIEKLAIEKEKIILRIGQLFEAKLAVTPYYKRHNQVGLVPDLMFDALLGIDVINRKSINVVIRAQSMKDRIEEEISAKLIDKCGVVPQEWFVEEPEDTTENETEDLHDLNEATEVQERGSGTPKQ